MCVVNYSCVSLINNILKHLCHENSIKCLRIKTRRTKKDTMKIATAITVVTISNKAIPKKERKNSWWNTKFVLIQAPDRNKSDKTKVTEAYIKYFNINLLVNDDDSVHHKFRTYMFGIYVCVHSYMSSRVCGYVYVCVHVYMCV